MHNPMRRYSTSILYLSGVQSHLEKRRTKASQAPDRFVLGIFFRFHFYHRQLASTPFSSVPIQSNSATLKMATITVPEGYG